MDQLTWLFRPLHLGQLPPPAKGCGSPTPATSGLVQRHQLIPFHAARCSAGEWGLVPTSISLYFDNYQVWSSATKLFDNLNVVSYTTFYMHWFGDPMAKVIEFNWDQWNRQKNEIKHGVSSLEAESAFFDSNYRLFRDVKHSTSKEERLILYARSSENRVLMIAFTIRGGLVRIITARPASKKERTVYEKEN